MCKEYENVLFYSNTLISRSQNSKYLLKVYCLEGDNLSALILQRCQEYCAIKRTGRNSIDLTCLGVIAKQGDSDAWYVECFCDDLCLNRRKINSASVASFKKAKVIFDLMFDFEKKSENIAF